MRKMKKFASLILAVIMVLSMTVAAFAEETEYKITVEPQESSKISLTGNTYYAYKLFDVTYASDKTKELGYAYTIANGFKNFEYVVEEKNEQGEVTKSTTYSEKRDATGHIIEGHLSLIEYVGSLDKDSDALNKFAEEALAYAQNKVNNVPVIEKKATESSVVIDVGEPGYYLVAGSATTDDNKTVTAACALSTAAPFVTVKVKADAPTLEKKIIETTTEKDETTEEVTTSEELVDANNAAIGDTVNYQITSRVPNMTGYEKYYFIVHDTLSKGLTFTNDATHPVTIQIVEIDETTEKITKVIKTLTEQEYTLETSPKKEDPTDDDSEVIGTELTIALKNFKDYDTPEYVNKTIIVKYSAVINNDAVIGNPGNDNVAHLQYSNNPNKKVDGDPDNPDKPKPGEVIGETPKDKVITYITGIELTKVDQNTTKPLIGAEFKITGTKINKIKILKDVFEKATDGTYYELKDGTYTEKEPDDSTRNDYVDETVKYKKNVIVEWNEETQKVSAIGVVGINGVIRFDGLAEGEYNIEEITAPDGYNRIIDPIKVIITCAEPDNVDSQDAVAKWTYTAKGKDSTGKEFTLNGENNTDGRIAFNITNNKGTLLPSTGGIGTTIFYAAGIILMAGAVFFVVRRKRA